MNNKHTSFCSLMALVVSSISITEKVSAATLSFDGTTFDDTGGTITIPQGYGDRVTSTTMGAFEYGVEGGFTPNITTSYLTSGGNELEYAGPFFGDLFGVAFNPDPSANWFAFQLQADPGFEVSLSGFDIAKFGGPDTLTSVQVIGSGGTELYRNDSIPFATGSSQFNNHANIEFAEPLKSSELTIRIETNRASAQWGVDNITFSQNPASPTPSEIKILNSEKAGNIFTIDFESEAQIASWAIQASSDLTSFSTDVTSETSITETSPGRYQASVDLSLIPNDLQFFRIAR